jgi:S1-C subfamily serine protease
MIGETMIVIGNPFGLGHTLTVGVVSALHRRIQINDRVYGEFIQTDASINPGNSGGAMLNILGELVGITTAIYSKAQGIGFAIPIDKAKRIVDDLIAYGQVEPGWLGIDVEDLTPQLSAALSAPAGSGVMVSKIWPNSPAEKAGIKAGAVISELDGKALSSKIAFKDSMSEITRNDSINVKYLSQGKATEVSIKAVEFPVSLASELSWELLGIDVVDAGGNGVKISKVDPASPAGKIGLGRGDIIYKVNQNALKTTGDFYQALIRNRNQSSVIIVIKRSNIFYYVTLPLRS